MRFLIALAVLAGAWACAPARAATLIVQPQTVPPNGVYSMYLDGESTTFNGASFSVRPDAGGMFSNVTSGNVAGVPRPPGDPFTYRNRLLDADPNDFPASKGWTLLGIVNTSQEIAFTGGPLGQTISTAGEPGGRLFLANIVLPPETTATANLTLVNGVDTVLTQTFIIFPPIVPEPTTLTLAVACALCVRSARRRGAA